MPSAVTRFYYRKDIETEAGRNYSLTVCYPFAFEVYINGKKIPAETQKTISFIAESGCTKIGIKTYLSNDPCRFLPVLSGQVYEGNNLVCRIDESWQSFTFAAFYTEKEDENWFCREYNEHYAGCYEFSPEEILRAQYFKKVFSVAQEVEKAEIAVTARGTYRLFINGTEIAPDTVLAPGVVSAAALGFPYSPAKCDLYQKYDVTSLIKKGKNIIALESGNGWYASEGFNTIRVAQNEIAVVLTLSSNAGTTVISSDKSWRCTPAPCVQNDLQWGERYDARLEIPAWNSEENTDGWLPCECTDTCVSLQEQMFPPVKVLETLPPISVTKSGGRFVCDFGENLTGRIGIRLRGTKAGQRVIVRYAEKLLKNGSLCEGPYHDVYFAKDTHRGNVAEFGARNIDVYIAKGAKEEIFEPDRAFTGFRYAEIVGVQEKKYSVVARRFGSDVPQALFFRCDNQLFNRIFDAAKNSIRGNVLCGPMDCPTREKNFWNGDIAMDTYEFTHMFQTRGILKYWTKYGRKIDSDAFSWRDECYLVPFALYSTYGDRSSLEENFDKIRAVIDGRIAKAKNGVFEDNTITFFGDYAQPAEYAPVRKEIFTQVWYYHCVDMFAQVCSVLQKQELARYYSSLLPVIRNAFREKLFPQLLKEAAVNIGEYVLSIAFGLVEGEDRKKLADILEDRLIRDNYVVSCGACACGYLLPVLTDAEKWETAWKVANCTVYPSWGQMIESGATTLTEYWGGQNSSDEGDSLNHHFKSGIVRWFVRYVAGLTASDGYRKIKISPRFLDKVKNLSLKYDSECGTVNIDWVVKDKKANFKVVTPVEGQVEIAGISRLLNIGCNIFEYDI